MTLQPYDVWNFAKCHDLYGREWPGRIPGQLIAHVLYFYTNPGDLVLDPMAGFRHHPAGQDQGGACGLARGLKD